MDEQLAAALATKRFGRPIDVQEDYYAGTRLAMS
jgi:hypothetical protein